MYGSHQKDEHIIENNWNNLRSNLILLTLKLTLRKGLKTILFSRSIS